MPANLLLLQGMAPSFDDPTPWELVETAVAAEAARATAEAARSAAENAYRAALAALEPYLADGPVTATVGADTWVVTRDERGIILLAMARVVPREE